MLSSCPKCRRISAGAKYRDRDWIATQLPSMRPSRIPHPASALVLLVALFHSDILPAVIAVRLSRRLFPSAPQTQKRLAQPVRAGNSARHDSSTIGAPLHCDIQFFQFLFPAVSCARSLLICADNSDFRQIPLHFAPSVPQRARATNKNPNPASIRALRFMDISRPLDLVP